jgi:hypothetical protein
MGKGKKAPDARVESFKRMYGVKPDTFEKCGQFSKKVRYFAQTWRETAETDH